MFKHFNDLEATRIKFNSQIIRTKRFIYSAGAIHALLDDDSLIEFRPHEKDDELMVFRVGENMFNCTTMEGLYQVQGPSYTFYFRVDDDGNVDNLYQVGFSIGLEYSQQQVLFSTERIPQQYRTKVLQVINMWHRMWMHNNHTPGGVLYPNRMPIISTVQDIVDHVINTVHPLRAYCANSTIIWMANNDFLFNKHVIIPSLPKIENIYTFGRYRCVTNPPSVWGMSGWNDLGLIKIPGLTKEVLIQIKHG